ncbi:MAG: hypothetical protein LBT04_03900 [Prevotellaceae bacterium]|jgi:hypothetical protein|nr:hypothetical protein [Prevotellaceae bacterium]
MEKTILIALTVFKNSSTLWFGKNKGELDIGNTMSDNYENRGIAKFPSTRERFEAALEADGITAAGAFIILALEVAILAATGPLTTMAINANLMSIGLGFVIASVWATVKAVGLDKVALFEPDKNGDDVTVKWVNQPIFREDTSGSTYIRNH